MIDAKKAKELAEVEFPDLHISACFDAGKGFAFTFVGEDNMPVPGTPVVIITKDDGSIDYLDVPPIENLKVLEEAKRIEI